MADAKELRVVFVIGGDGYEVSRLAADPAVARAAFRFRKLAGDQAVYDLRVVQGGGIECQCLGYLRWGSCKHRSKLAEASALFNLAGRA